MGSLGNDLWNGASNAVNAGWNAVTKPIDEITGKAASQAAQGQAQATTSAIQGQVDKMQPGVDAKNQYYTQSMGADAGDFLKKSYEASKQQASDMAQNASTGASQKAIGAARTAGLNPAQAAMLGAEQGANAYQGTYGNQVGQQQAMYGNAAQNAGQLAATGQGQIMGALSGNQQAAGQQAAIAGQQQNAMTSGLFGAGTSLITALASDERVKDVDGSSKALEAFRKHVGGYDFNYKGNPEKLVGVMAQDLEKTPLKANVIEGPGGVKMVDTKKQTMSNTALIAELANEVEDLKKGKKK